MSLENGAGNYELVAKLRNLKTLVQLLKAVNFKEFATCYGTGNGLKVTVEDAKCMQASAYIPTEIFEEFNLRDDVMFRINLSVFVECLSMFWGDINSQDSCVALQLFYKGTGHPVTVLIEAGGIITDCSLKTLDPHELLDFNLAQDNVFNKVLLKTELLRDVLSELDTTCDVLELLLSPEAPYLRISTDGIAGECQVEIPKDSNLVESFQCNTTASSCYKLSHIRPAMKPLTCAIMVSMKTDDCGLLCLQYMVKTEDGHTCYVEYYISPVVDMED